MSSTLSEHRAVLEKYTKMQCSCNLRPRANYFFFNIAASLSCSGESRENTPLRWLCLLISGGLNLTLGLLGIIVAATDTSVFGTCGLAIWITVLIMGIFHTIGALMYIYQEVRVILCDDPYEIYFPWSLTHIVFGIWFNVAYFYVSHLCTVSSNLLTLLEIDLVISYIVTAYVLLVLMIVVYTKYKIRRSLNRQLRY